MYLGKIKKKITIFLTLEKSLANDSTCLDLDDNSDEIEEKWSAFTAHKSGLIRKWSGSALTMGRDTTEEPEPTSLFKSGRVNRVTQLRIQSMSDVKFQACKFIQQHQDEQGEAYF